MIDKTDVGAWARTVGQWVGDSPTKAVTFGVACALLGSVWGGWFGFWPL